MRFLVWIVTNVIALAVAAWLFAGITVSGDHRLLTLIAVGVIFGVVTSVVKPVVKFFSFPFIILTLGLLLLVINAAMLMLTSALADGMNINFHVDGFWTALFASIVISVVSSIVGALLPDPDNHRDRANARR